MKKVIYAACGIIIVLILGLLGGAWYFSSVLLNPGPHVCPKDHYVYCTNPSELDLKYEDVIIRTSDDIMLNAWYIPGSSGSPGILMMHGRGATRREALRYVPSLNKKGFNLLLIDVRNCGESDRSFNSMGFHERKDVHAGIDYLLNDRKVPSAGVYGFSMGASTCIMAMAENRRIKAGVFESGFIDFDTVTMEVAKRDYGLPRYPLLPLVTFFYEMRGNLSTTDPSPLKVIASIAPRPVYIIHGTADKEVYYSHGQALFKAARQPKQFWSIPGCGHTRAWNADRSKAETDIPAFFEKYL